MQSETIRRALWLCLPCLLLALIVTASALEGGDFTGAYRMSHVAKDRNVVHLTLTLQLRNHGETDVHDGTVALMDNQPRRNPIGGFPTIKLLRLHDRVILRQNFDVPRTEYDRWISGGQPNLMVLFKEHGTVIMRNIQLTHREPWAGSGTMSSREKGNGEETR
jgi:hypothetical protein